MDYPLVMARLRPNEDWGPCCQTGETYANLKRMWRGKTPCPTEAEIDAAWAGVKVEIDGQAEARAVEKERVRQFMDAPNGTVTAAQRDAAIKTIIRRLRILEER